MKKLLKIISLALIIFTGGILCACGAIVATPSISLSQESLELRIGDSENETKTLDVIISNYGEGSTQLNFSTDNPNLVNYTSEYIGNGKTRLTLTGVNPGTATITVRSLQGGATKTLTIKVVQPITNLSLNSAYAEKLYIIKGSTLSLNNADFYSFLPTNTNEKSLIFSLITNNSGCQLNEEVLSVNSNCSLSSVRVSATSKNDNSKSIIFDVKVLNPIASTLEVGYEVSSKTVVGTDINNYLKIYPSDTDKSIATAILTITAGTSDQLLNVEKIFNSGEEKFLVSQVGYEYNNGKHIYTFTIQSNSLDAGKIDSLIFNISYKNYSVGKNNYSVLTNKLNINSYNYPTSVKVNNQTAEAEIEIFENSINLSNGKLIEFTVLPGNFEANTGADKIKIWAGNYSNCAISLYKMNPTRSGYILVYGYDANGNFVCDNTNFTTTGLTPYVEINSGTKLYSFINSKYSSTSASSYTKNMYAQSSFYYDNGAINNKVLTSLNFVINPNANNIFLADLEGDTFTKNDNTSIYVEYGTTTTQYIAIDPATFIIASSSGVSITNSSLAVLGDLTSVSYDDYYVYGSFTIQALKLGSTTLKITLSDGKSKTITLNVISSLGQLDIRIKDSGNEIGSDIIPWAEITDTMATDSNVSLNKVSIANSGSTVQFIKTAIPTNAEYYLTYKFLDYTIPEGTTLEYLNITPASLESLFGDSNKDYSISNILNVSSMKNFSIIEALSSRTEGNVLLKIDVYGRESGGQYSANPVGSIYYLINFFIPISSLNITNGTVSIYPYDSIGDKFINSNGQNLSMGSFSVSINSANGSVSPTYINTLKIYVNERVSTLTFTNDICYLNSNGEVVSSLSNAVLKVIRTRSDNTFTFNVQALKSSSQNFVLTFEVTEINGRKITGVSRIFIQKAVEISDIELVNIDIENGIYFDNLNNSNSTMSLEIVANLYSADGSEITNRNLAFDWNWSYTNVNDYTGLVKIEKNKNGNYVLTIDKSFSGVGTLRIYPESNYYNSSNGWNGEGPYHLIPIRIGDGLTEETAIEINEVADLTQLNNSNKYYVLTSNIDLTAGNYEISNFSGSLNGSYFGKTYTITTNKPIFVNINSGAIIKNLSIVAMPISEVNCKYSMADINGTETKADDVSAFGFLACLNEGTITDVNIEANTNFKSTAILIGENSTTTTNIYAMGLLVGVNKGTIQYNNGTTLKINVYGTNNGLNETGSTYAGGIVGYDLGTISGAHVAVPVTGTNVGNFSGNKLDAFYTDCTSGIADITNLQTKLNPNEKTALNPDGKTASEIIADPEGSNIILYYYNIPGVSLTDDELGKLKAKNTIQFSDLVRLYYGETGYDYSLFNFASSNKNIINVVGKSLEINGVGKVTLTITPKYSSNATTKEITIYVLYPINSYATYSGISAGSYSNIIKDNGTINIKKSGTYYLTVSLKNTVVIGSYAYTILQNKLSIDVNVNENFEITGNTTNSTGDNKFGLGTIAVKAGTDVDKDSDYELISTLMLQNKNNILGNIDSTNNVIDFETINSLLALSFNKSVNIDVYVGAEKIQSTVSGTDLEPSYVRPIEVIITTDDEYDKPVIVIRDKMGNVVWEKGNEKNIFGVSDPKPQGTSDKTKKFNFFIYIQDDYRSKITDITNYFVYVYANSTKDSANPVYLVLNLTVYPQEVISVTYSHHHRADDSSETNFKVNEEPSSILTPGESGLLAINLYPSYATYEKIVIESSIVNDEFYVLLEQMYYSNGSYLTASGVAGYSSVRNANKLTIYYSNALSEDDGMIYIRTKILNSVSEGLSFPITIKIYALDENGEEKEVKNEQINLSSQVVDKAIITINDGKEAVVVRGHDNVLKISVPENQTLAKCLIYNKNDTTNPEDTIRPYFNETEYEIINGRKVYTGRLTVGLNAELTGEDSDGVFDIQTVVTRIINGLPVNSTDSIKVTVVDFLVEGIHIKGNNEEDNVFETPLAIEKELQFEFDLSDTPSYYTADQKIAVDRIQAAKDYFLQNTAYKYVSDSGKYSYIVNTDRVFVKDLENIETEWADAYKYIVSSQVPSSIAYNLYYTSDMTPCVGQENPYVLIKHDGYNNNGTILDMESNLLKVTGSRIGEQSFTIKIGYQLPGKTDISYIKYNFKINIKIYSDEDKPIPIYNANEFIEYLSDNTDFSDKNYILMDDLILENFVPFNTTNFSSLDGNNKVITIKDFDISNASNTLNVGLFENIEIGVTVKNITISYYQLNNIIIDETKVSIVNIAGLAVNNYGIVYNCEVIALDKNEVGGYDSNCGIRIYFSATDINKAKQDTTRVNIAGLVVNNQTTGCITNSRVGGYTFTKVSGDSSTCEEISYEQKNINIIGQGDVAGFVIANSGVISSSYFANGKIINNSLSGTETITAGFVKDNYYGAIIASSYSKGIKLGSDIGAYVTGGGIVAQGITAGFAYQNEGEISDSYSNIKLAGESAGRIVSGFVYNNRNKGLVENCYSASTIVGSLTTQMPFSGNNARGENMQEVEGGLVNCYYLIHSYSSQSIMEEKYSTGAIAIATSSISQNQMYGLSFRSNDDTQDGSWYWVGDHAELIEANNIAISARYIIDNYSGLISSGQSVESVNAFPYIKGYQYGSVKNPIIIRTADEYNRVFGKEVDTSYYYAISQMYDLERGIIFGNYRLVSHIDFNQLTVVGSSKKILSSSMILTQSGEYKGVFDGNGLTISNIEISLDNQTAVGLISKVVNSAVFKNVNLTVIRIYSGTGVYVGGAVGYVENAFVNNISVSPVNITGENKSQITGYNIVGGVVGYVVGNSKISNLTSSISVISKYIASNKASYNRFNQSLIANNKLSYAGGIVGIIDIYNDLYDIYVNTSDIDAYKLKFYGKNVTVQGSVVGGIVGYVGISTYFVDALFEITGSSKDTVFNQKLISYGNIIGGIVGINYGKLYEVRIEHERDTQKVIEDNLDGYYSSLTSPVFKGNTTLFNTTTTSLEYIGGLVGQMMKGELTTSYSKIDVSNVLAEYAGGLIGFNNAETTFTELYTFGDVDGKIAGGLIGENKGKIKLSYCVAMNYYSKNNSKVVTGYNYLAELSATQNAELKEIEERINEETGKTEIDLKFQGVDAQVVVVKSYVQNLSYDNNISSISQIHANLGDELYLYTFNDFKVISNGEKYWKCLNDNNQWDELTKQVYGRFGLDYYYSLGTEIVFYGITDSKYIYIKPTFNENGYIFTLPMIVGEEVKISSSGDNYHYSDRVVVKDIEYKYTYASATVTINGTPTSFNGTLYKGKNLANNEIYVYIDTTNYQLLVAEDVDITSANEQDSEYSALLSSRYAYETNAKEISRSSFAPINIYKEKYQYIYDFIMAIPSNFNDLSKQTVSDRNINEGYKESTIRGTYTYYHYWLSEDSWTETTWSTPTITTQSFKSIIFSTPTSSSVRTLPKIYSIFDIANKEAENNGEYELSNDGVGNIPTATGVYVNPEEESVRNLSRIGSIIGKVSLGYFDISGFVYATNSLTLGNYKLTISPYASAETGVDLNDKIISPNNLTINGDIGNFDKEVDTITTNGMFLSAGWSTNVWAKDENRIFPYLNFGIINNFVYIEKPTDFVKLYKYYGQSVSIVFGDDPDTLFNPYRYDPSSEESWGDFKSEDLIGLSLNSKTLTFDISGLSAILEANGMGHENYYFEQFLGRIYCELSDYSYIITGMEKALFNQIIGGTISGLTFGSESYQTEISTPVLAWNIFSETKLYDLEFKNIALTSSSPNLGIITNQMTNVSLIKDITIQGCEIELKSINNDLNNDLKVGLIAGIIDSDSGNYTASISNVVIQNSTINIVGNALSENDYAYVGCFFGFVAINIIYTDCLITGSGLQVKTNTNVYAGGYAGSASGMTQTIVNTSSNTSSSTAFINDLFINILKGTNITAGLMFGEANVYSTNLGINVSGIITNNYGNSSASAANVGGILGSGSGNFDGITVQGVMLSSETSSECVLIDIKTNADENSEFIKVGGAIGNATTTKLYINNVKVYGDIIVSNTASTTEVALFVGGLVGYTRNEYTILNSGYYDYIDPISGTIYNSDININEITENNKTIIYAGLIGYSDTGTGAGDLILGTYENGVYKNGNTFEGDLTISGGKTIYAGGMIGTTSDALNENVNKICVYDSKVSGDINITSVVNDSTIKIGGIAGYVVATVEGNYAWGNIKLNDGLIILHLYLGGIVGQIDGISNSNTGTFKDNFSLTAIYNENRATNHYVRALIGSSVENITYTSSSNYYCHQIALCIDLTSVGTNLPYYSTDNYSAITKQTILSKFVLNGKDLNGKTVISGSKLSPNVIDSNNYSSATFDEGKYYVLEISTDAPTYGMIKATAPKDISGHLVGDGFSISSTDVSPFGKISGAVAGIQTYTTKTYEYSSGTIYGEVSGFAKINEGIIFACTSKLTSGSVNGNRYGSDGGGFALLNSGLISDCGVVLYASHIAAGFCRYNTGIIANSYATGSLTLGANQLFNSNDDGNKIYTNSWIINCYVALKDYNGGSAFNGSINESIINCYYDKNAAEKTLSGGTAYVTSEMSTYNYGTTDILGTVWGLIKNAPANEQTNTWLQSYEYNFGYPTLSSGAYRYFSYLQIDTGDGDKNFSFAEVQIPNAGKLAQLQNSTADKAYRLVNNVNITNAGFSQWEGINLTGSFDGGGAYYNYETHKYDYYFSISDVPPIVKNDYGNAGFFVSVYYGSITDVSVSYKDNTNLNITIVSDTRVGGLVGDAKNATISNCTVNMKLTVNGNIYKKIYVGGIVGYSDNSTINNNNFGATAETGSLESDGKNFESIMVGGIAGAINGGSVQENNAEQVYINIGSLEANKVYVAGVVGFRFAGIINNNRSHYTNMTAIAKSINKVESHEKQLTVKDKIFSDEGTHSDVYMKIDSYYIMQAYMGYASNDANTTSKYVKVNVLIIQDNPDNDLDGTLFTGTIECKREKSSTASLKMDSFSPMGSIRRKNFAGVVYTADTLRGDEGSSGKDYYKLYYDNNIMTYDDEGSYDIKSASFWESAFIYYDGTYAKSYLTKY